MIQTSMFITFSHVVTKAWVMNYFLGCEKII